MKSANISNLAIVLLSVTLMGGGGYAFYKVNQIQNQNSYTVTELEQKIEQFVSPEIATSSNFESTTTQTIKITTDDTQKEDNKYFDKVYIAPANIPETKPFKNEEISIASNTIITPSAPENSKVEEKKKFDIYWVTVLSVAAEQNAAEAQINAAINMINQDSAIAYSYAQEALKLCDSGHKINSENIHNGYPSLSGDDKEKRHVLLLAK